MNLAEDSMLFVANAGIEVETVHVTAANAVAERNPPEALHFQLVSALVVQGAEKSAAGWVEGINPSITEIADQQRTAENAKGRRRQSYSPRRVKRAIRNQPL